MKAFLLAIAVMIFVSVAANAVLQNAGWGADDKAASPGSVRLGD